MILDLIYPLTLFQLDQDNREKTLGKSQSKTNEPKVNRIFFPVHEETIFR